jgi:outer membrane cobalamin receptor
MGWTREMVAGAALLTLQVGSGSAQQADTVRVIPLDPVVVTVTHLEVLRSRLPNSVSVISREQIRESGAASVLQVVNEHVPGVFVTQRGVLGYGVAQGAAGRITMRGVGASPNTQVLVMTDGRPQMMGLMGHPIADSHVSSNVERVEIVRGPASVLYGTSAMGGVVNIITRRHWLPGTLAEGGITYGSHDTRRFEGAVEYGIGTETGISAAANSYRTDGHRPWSSFEIDNASVRGSTVLRPGLTLLADASLSDLHTFDPGPVATPRVENWVDILRTTSGASLENRGGAVEGATRVFVNTGRHRIHDGFFSRDYTAGVQVHQGMRLAGGRTLTVGGDAKRFGGEAENERTSVNWGSHTADEVGAFAMLHTPLIQRVIATGGLRVNHHSAYGIELAPQAGVAVNLADGTTVRGHSARGFRSPTIRELYLFPAPTPDLEPERAWSSEISILQQLGGRTTVELALYRTEGSNLIRTTGAPPNLRLENTGEFLHRGGEVAIRTAPVASLEVDAAWGYLDVGALTQSHPKHQFSAGARYAFHRFTARMGLQHVAGLYAADFARNRLPDYTVVNARIAAQLPGRVTAFLSGENLLDEQYQVMAGYPMPGRGISLGLQARSR